MNKVYVGDRGVGKSHNLIVKYNLYKNLGYEPKVIVQSQEQIPLYLNQGVLVEDIIPIIQLVQDNGWVRVARDKKYILIFDDVLYTLGRLFRCPILASVDSSDVSVITKKSASVVASYDSLVDRAKHGPIEAKILVDEEWKDITIYYDEIINEIYYVRPGQYVLITPQDKIYVE